MHVEATAYVAEEVDIGSYSSVWHHAVLHNGTVIGDYTSFGCLSVCEGNTRIGNHCSIHSQVHVTSKMEIGNWVFVAPLTVFTNTKKIVRGRDYPLVEKGPTICDGVRIGAGVTVLPGVVIGQEALIGAGSVVTKDVPPLEIWFGNPARKVGEVPEDEYHPALQNERRHL